MKTTPAGLLVPDTVTRESWTSVDRKFYMRLLRFGKEKNFDLKLICRGCKENCILVDQPNDYLIACGCKDRVMPK